MNQPASPVIPAAAGVFVQTLAAMHGGKVLEDLDDAIRDVTRSVNDAQIKGKLTLEIIISPNGVGVGDTPLLKVEDKIKVSLPKKAREPKSVFFADDNHNLTRRNPNQEEIKFTVSDGGKISGESLKAAAAAGT